MLESYVEACPNYTTNLDEMRTLFVVLVGYAGFLRIGEILGIQLRHITIKSEYMEILLPKRKNDQFRQGQYVWEYHIYAFAISSRNLVSFSTIRVNWVRIVYGQEGFQIPALQMFLAKACSVTEDGSSHNQKINILNRQKVTCFYQLKTCLSGYIYGFKQ